MNIFIEEKNQMRKLIFATVICLSVCIIRGTLADLVAHYDFETGSGTTAYDTSGYGTAANGTFVGTGVSWVPGKVGNSAVSFNTARDSWINCGKGTKLDIAGQISLAFWLKADANDNTRWNMLVSKGNDNGYRVCRDSGGNATNGITFATSGHYPGDNVFASNVLDGQWHHVATTYAWDGTSAVSRIYIDGVLTDENTGIGYDISRNSYNLLLGNNEQYSSPMCGSLDDVRIYNHALNQAEVNALIPEPLTMTLLSVGGLTLLRRRRR